MTILSMQKKNINSMTYHLKISRENIDSIEFLQKSKIFLKEKRMFMLTLLENPNLLEHESFTDLLRSVFHFTEELDKRPELYNLPNLIITILKRMLKGFLIS